MAQQNLTFNVRTTGVQNYHNKMKAVKAGAVDVASGVKNAMGVIAGSLVVAKVTRYVNAFADAGDEIGKGAKKIGSSAEEYPKAYC